MSDERLIEVQGRCPACGNETLFVGDEGCLICSLEGCPMPDAADRLLSEAETEHLVTCEDEKHFTMEHPLIERLDDGLTGCLLHRALTKMPPLIPGRYRFIRRNAKPEEFGWSVETIEYFGGDPYGHPPCCGACGGKGATLSGPCSDCYGTGHPHPPRQEGE